ncbi:MAG: C4-type zinc ribbon domain-containing protein [Deltaproteobacteria bacterium]|nr:C4-type zinc ribbon domain-containing protein [Deltaproteobacteria bacterium]
MQEVIAKFIELQKLEDEIIAAERILEEGPRQLAESQEKLDGVRAAHDDIASRLAEARAGLKVLEEELAKLKDLKEGNRLRATKANDERSYKAVLSEQDTIKKLTGENEEGTLTAMEEIDRLQEALPPAAKLLKESEAAHAKLSRTVRAQVTEAEAAVSSRRGVIDGMLATIDPAAAEHFVNSAKAHNGKAMAPVTESTCLACRMRIPPQLYNELQGHTKIMLCPSCARIMHFVPPPPKEEPSAKSAAAKRPKKAAPKPAGRTAEG